MCVFTAERQIEMKRRKKSVGHSIDIERRDYRVEMREREGDQDRETGRENLREKKR